MKIMRMSQVNGNLGLSKDIFSSLYGSAFEDPHTEIENQIQNYRYIPVKGVKQWIPSKDFISRLDTSNNPFIYLLSRKRSCVRLCKQSGTTNSNA